MGREQTYGSKSLKRRAFYRRRARAIREKRQLLKEQQENSHSAPNCPKRMELEETASGSLENNSNHSGEMDLIRASMPCEKNGQTQQIAPEITNTFVSSASSLIKDDPDCDFTEKNQLNNYSQFLNKTAKNQEVVNFFPYTETDTKKLQDNEPPKNELEIKVELEYEKYIENSTLFDLGVEKEEANNFNVDLKYVPSNTVKVELPYDTFKLLNAEDDVVDNKDCLESYAVSEITKNINVENKNGPEIIVVADPIKEYDVNDFVKFKDSPSSIVVSDLKTQCGKSLTLGVEISNAATNSPDYLTNRPTVCKLKMEYNMIVCKLCNSYFGINFDFDDFEKHHYSCYHKSYEPIKNLYCNLYDCEFKTCCELILKYHLSKVHSQWHRCECCDFRTSYLSKYKTHVLSHEENSLENNEFKKALCETGDETIDTDSDILSKVQNTIDTDLAIVNSEGENSQASKAINISDDVEELKNIDAEDNLFTTFRTKCTNILSIRKTGEKLNFNPMKLNPGCDDKIKSLFDISSNQDKPYDYFSVGLICDLCKINFRFGWLQFTQHHCLCYHAGYEPSSDQLLYKCNFYYCSFKTCCEILLTYHYCQVHTVRYKCRYCDFTTTSKIVFKIHTCEHEDEDPSKINRIGKNRKGKKVKQKGTVLSLYHYFLSCFVIFFKCKYCDFKSTSAAEFDVHLSMHLANDACDNCDTKTYERLLHYPYIICTKCKEDEHIKSFIVLKIENNDKSTTATNNGDVSLRSTTDFSGKTCCASVLENAADVRNTYCANNENDISTSDLSREALALNSMFLSTICADVDNTTEGDKTKFITVKPPPSDISDKKNVKYKRNNKLQSTSDSSGTTISSQISVDKISTPNQRLEKATGRASENTVWLGKLVIQKSKLNSKISKPKKKANTHSLAAKSRTRYLRKKMLRRCLEDTI